MVLAASSSKSFPIRDYDLGATLSSGQAFRWQWRDQSWTGVIGLHWLRLRSDPFSITGETAEPVSSWDWLTNYLQLEVELRACKMGFRAPYLLETARSIVAEQLDLERLQQMPVEAARLELLKLPGVGRKIADCVLLFAYGFQSAFPVDVWVMKALRQLYFPKRKVTMQRLHRFAAQHFGICAGYAQQYLFHYMRTRGKLEYRNPK